MRGQHVPSYNLIKVQWVQLNIESYVWKEREDEKDSAKDISGN